MTIKFNIIELIKIDFNFQYNLLYYCSVITNDEIINQPLNIYFCKQYNTYWISTLFFLNLTT